MDRGQGTEEQQISKSDVPWLYRGPVMMFIYGGAGVSMIYAAIFKPEFRAFMPGRRDFIAGVPPGVILGWLAGILLAASMRRKMLACGRKPWLILLVPDISVSAFAAAACLFAALVLAIVIRRALGDSLTQGGSGAFMGLFLPFSCMMAWRYNKWYQTLPDQHPRPNT